MEIHDRKRAERRILMYWAILRKAGYDADEGKLATKLGKRLDPGYRQDLRDALYGKGKAPVISSLTHLVSLR
jgi:hypothetical protein